MNDSSLLETTAEIAVAFAGFVSVFVVLGSRDGRFAPHDALSIKVIVVGSVLSVIYSVIPVLLHSLGVPEPAVWRASSGLLAVIGGTSAVYMVRMWRAIPQEDKRGSTGFHLAADMVFSAILLLCVIANFFAWPWTPSGGVYLLGVWSNLMTVGTSFVILIFESVLQD